MYSQEDDKRLVVLNTTAQEYDEDSAGYGNYLGSDFKAEKKAAKETNIEGLESLYNALLKHTGVNVSHVPVEGCEGFVDTIKAGAQKLWQMIMDFLRWMKGVFTGKKRELDRTEKEVKELYKTGTLKTKATYPSDICGMMPAKKPVSPALDDNLNWLTKEVQNLWDFLARVKNVVNGCESALAGNVRLLKEARVDWAHEATQKEEWEDTLFDSSKIIVGMFKLDAVNIKTVSRYSSFQGVPFGSHLWSVQAHTGEIEFNSLQMVRSEGTSFTFTPNKQEIAVLVNKLPYMAATVESVTDLIDKVLKKYSEYLKYEISHPGDGVSYIVKNMLEKENRSIIRFLQSLGRKLTETISNILLHCWTTVGRAYK